MAFATDPPRPKENPRRRLPHPVQSLYSSDRATLSILGWPQIAAALVWALAVVVAEPVAATVVVLALAGALAVAAALVWALAVVVAEPVAAAVAVLALAGALAVAAALVWAPAVVVAEPVAASVAVDNAVAALLAFLVLWLLCACVGSCCLSEPCASC